MASFNDNMQRLQDQVAKNMVSAALASAAAQLLADAKDAAPVVTGALRDSGVAERPSGNSVTVGFEADYAALVHESDGRGSPNRFLGGPLRQNRKKYLGAIAKEIERAL